MDATTVEALKAGAAVAAALAWPVVAVVGMLVFRPQLRNLLNRLREGGGAKFDPIPQSQEVSATILTASTSAASGSAMAFARTASVVRWEQTVRDTPQLKALMNPTQREEFLVNSMAGLLVLFQFELAESQIYASQLALLQYLQIKPGGEARDTVSKLFYEPAAAQYPELYANFAIDLWLAFLQARMLTSEVNGIIRLEELGSEYLAWRLQQRRAAKQYG